MENLPLAGKKIAIIVENKFIPEEIAAYRILFGSYGAEVHFISRLWYDDYHPEKTTFYSDVDPLDNDPWASPEKLVADHEVTQITPGDYAAILMSANYTSVRLRFFPMPADQAGTVTLNPGEVRAMLQSPPVVRFFAGAMQDKCIVKGALCHGLWILTPHPELLKDRKVICNPVVMADIANCEAVIVTNEARVVVDGDLVTGLSKHEVIPYVQAITQQILNIRKEGCA